MTESEKADQQAQLEEWRERCGITGPLPDNRVDADLRAAALMEALTPSGDTKADYMGEFSFRMECADENGDPTTISVPVPWTTIKEIMAAISARAALSLRRLDTEGGEG